MIANKDSLGNILTKEQIEYFKNTKVTNDKNELIVCYHGSPNAGFRVFNPQNSKSQFGDYKFGNANVNYFTTDKSSASSYTLFKYDDGTVYEVYLDIENPYIVDSNGNKRFINGYGIWSAVSGMQGESARWSLNGYNLMFEALGSFSLEASGTIVSFKLPKWILNKIIAPFQDVVDMITFKIVGALGDSSDIPLIISKTTNDKIAFRITNVMTITEPKIFRIHYNLIIDDL